MIPNDITSAVQVYVQTQSSGEVTAPVNGSWLQAYAEWLGVTNVTNVNWVQTICEYYGVNAPRNGSWVQALAVDQYGLTAPLNNSWWYALANMDEPVTILIWNTTTTQWQNETTLWNA